MGCRQTMFVYFQPVFALILVLLVLPVMEKLNTLKLKKNNAIPNARKLRSTFNTANIDTHFFLFCQLLSVPANILKLESEVPAHNRATSDTVVFKFSHRNLEGKRNFTFDGKRKRNLQASACCRTNVDSIEQIV